MAEKGILVSDASSGESVACRDAVELDNDSNARIIQRVDVSKGKVGTLPINSAANGLRQVNNADSKDIETLTSSNPPYFIEVGDKSTLVVFVDFELDQDQDVDITPIIFNDETTPECIGVLETKNFAMTTGSTLYKGTGAGSGSGSASGSAAGLGSVYPSEGWTGYQMAGSNTWDVCGAHKIILHVTSLTQTATGYLSAWGYVI